jgi:hypothetical protein
LLALLCLPAAMPCHAGSLAVLDQGAVPPAAACSAAIARAQARYALPPGLLLAIGLAESGRVDPTTRRMRPWPWAVQAGGRSLYFESRAEAVAWVRNAQAGGTASVDTGCLQVNLMFHPTAFATVDAAFDPEGNVDYAARFLVSLHDETRDWTQAIGFYHSRTPALAAPYQQRVRVNMGAVPGAVAKDSAIAALSAPPMPPGLAEQMAIAWRATTEPTAGVVPAKRDWSTLLQRRPDSPAPPPAIRRRIVAILSIR